VSPRATSTPDGGRGDRSTASELQPGPAPGLDLELDMGFERRSWAFQRIGWALMAVVVIAALLGAFGTGPMSRAEVRSGPIRLEYPRFARVNAPAAMKIEVEVPARPDDPVTLWFDDALLDRVRIESVTPQPAVETMRNGRIVYVFPPSAAGERFRATVRIEPESTGVVRARAGDGSDNAVSFWQLIYP
jgi:hypothetical protein